MRSTGADSRETRSRLETKWALRGSGPKTARCEATGETSRFRTERSCFSVPQAPVRLWTAKTGRTVDETSAHARGVILAVGLITLAAQSRKPAGTEHTARRSASTK